MAPSVAPVELDVSSSSSHNDDVVKKRTSKVAQLWHSILPSGRVQAGGYGQLVVAKPPRRLSEESSIESEDGEEREARQNRSARLSVKLMNRLSWGYNSRAPTSTMVPTGYRPASLPAVPSPRATEAVSVGDLLTAAPVAADVDSRGCCHRAHRVLTGIVDVVVAAPARAAAPAAWLMSRLSCEETFPEPEKEAEFQESWRDENRAAVGPRRLFRCLSRVTGYTFDTPSSHDALPSIFKPFSSLRDIFTSLRPLSISLHPRTSTFLEL